ncbi:MAG: hypothetical protein ACI87E_003196 [Mariniblastus sp.]|jgi:hypothetical protein
MVMVKNRFIDPIAAPSSPFLLDKTDMNAKSNHGKPFKLDWKRIGIFVIVIGVVGYQWYTEKSSDSDSVAFATKPLDNGDQESFSKADDEVNFPTQQDGNSKQAKGGDRQIQDNRPTKTNSANSQTNQQQPKKSGSYLLPAGGKNLKSPGGLIYSGDRSDHVLRHDHDMPERPTHGVFTANGDDVFRLIDEAYVLIKAKSSQVRTKEAGGGKTEYVIDLKRKIGHKGGQSGKRQSNPALYKVKLILADNRIVTAFPY